MARWSGIQASTAGGRGSISGLRTKTPQAAWWGKERKKEKQETKLSADESQLGWKYKQN